jgi:hypothetical protein
MTQPAQWFKDRGPKNDKKRHKRLSFHAILLLFAWPVATMATTVSQQEKELWQGIRSSTWAAVNSLQTTSANWKPFPFAPC